MLDEEHVEHVEQFDLALLERLEAEVGEHGLQELYRRELCLRDVCEYNVVFQLVEERVDQGGFTGPDLAGDDDEAIRQPDSRLHVRFGLGMLFAEVQEFRVRTEPKRRLSEGKVLEVHHKKRPWAGPDSSSSGRVSTTRQAANCDRRHVYGPTTPSDRYCRVRPAFGVP